MKKIAIKKIKIKKKDIAFILFLTFCFLIIIFIEFIARPVSIKGESMENTLFPNEWVLLWKWEYIPEREDIVIVDTTEHGLIVKRIIGVQGDELIIHEGTVRVNGILIDESYVKDSNWESKEINIIIPDKQAFVMGDNRNQSFDSRNFGTVNFNQIKGKIIL